MERALSEEEISLLSYFSSNGDRIGYYTALANLGVRYGSLALDVVNNDHIGGQVANGYFLSYAYDRGEEIANQELAQIGLELMRADLSIRAFGTLLNSFDYQLYHEQVFASHGVSRYGWTPSAPLEMAERIGGLEARESLWNSMVNDPSLIAAGESAYYVGQGLLLDQSDPLYVETGRWTGAMLDVYVYYNSSNVFGNYTVSNGNGFVIGGAAGVDTLSGSAGNDIIMTFDGSLNSASGNLGNDTVYGGRGNDWLAGGQGTDQLIAGEGDDILVGGDFSPGMAEFRESSPQRENHEWEDGVRDLLEGGSGDDRYYLFIDDRGDAPTMFEGDNYIGLLEKSDLIFDSDGLGRIFVQDVENEFPLYRNPGTHSEDEFLLHVTQFEGRFELFWQNKTEVRYVDGEEIWSGAQIDHYQELDETSSAGRFKLDVREGKVILQSDHYMAPKNFFYGVIEDFRQGDFGIFIDGYESPKEGTARADSIQVEVITGSASRAGMSADGYINSSHELNIVALASNADSAQRIHADAGDDIVHGRGGDDEIRGDEGNDTLYGDEGNDRLTGGDGDDGVFGGTGDDTFVGGNDLGNALLDGDDLFDGGEGSDTADYAAASAAIVVDLASGLATGSSIGSDTLASVENVRGGSGTDSLTGSLAANILTGGDGADRFIFAGDFGDDRITDFSAGEDVLVLHGAYFQDFNAVLAASSQVGGDLRIAAGAHGTILLDGFTLDQLTAAAIELTEAIVPPGTPDIVKPTALHNVSIGAALNLAGTFDLDFNADITDSTVVPHTTVLAVASGAGQEYYRFSGHEGNRAIFDIDGAAFDTILELLDASGNVVAWNDDSDGDPGSGSYNSYFDHVFAATDVYYLRVSAYGGDGVPVAGLGYTLHVSTEPLTQPLPVSVDKPDILKPSTMANADPSTAILVDGSFDLIANAEIANASTIPHATVIAESGGNFEFYAVSAKAGAVGIFDIDAASFDTVIDLFDSSGNIIGSSDDNSADPGSSQYASLIEHNFQSDGTYYLRVGRFSNDGNAPVAEGETFTLHFSISSATVDYMD